MTPYDIVVLGAGPAGCAAAIHAAGRGLRVALVERAEFPRDRPGEALHPGVDTLFERLGLADAVAGSDFVRYPGWIRERGASRDFVPFTGVSGAMRFGYQAWRADLDSMLLDRARHAGATVLQPCSSERVFISEGRVAGLRTSFGDLRCRQMIDATGSQPWLVRKLRLPVKQLSPRLIARYGYFDGGGALGTMPVFREEPGGWTWIARVKQDRYQWVRLRFSGRDRSLAPPPPFARKRPASPVRGSDVTWRHVPECAGPGYILCGDAAAILDPSASGGVIRAMAAGLRAAGLVACLLKDGVDEAAALRGYRAWILKRFATEALELCSRYAQFPDPPEWLGDAERRGRELLDRIHPGASSAA